MCLGSFEKAQEDRERTKENHYKGMSLFNFTLPPPNFPQQQPPVVKAKE